MDNLDFDREDNPREVFDNSPSHIPWDDTGRFNTPEKMREQVNTTDLRDPMWIRVMGPIAAVLTCGGYWKAKRKGVQEGTFREVQKGIYTTIVLPGYYVRWSPKSKWGPIHPLDDEVNDLVPVGRGFLLKF